MDRSFFAQCYDLAIAAANPAARLKDAIPKNPKGRVLVLGAGKGAAHLARDFERVYLGEFEGLVVTRYGYAVECEQFEVMEAAHPVPDAMSMNAAKIFMQKAEALSSDDQLIALITGGGSALLAAPLAPMTIEDEIALNKALLASGAPIGAMNTVRRHLSQIKGGRLAELARPAEIVSLIVSDVPGDDPAEVASGPTVAGNTTPADALEVIEKYQLRLPENALKALESDAANTPARHGEMHILASAKQSLAAVEAQAIARGLNVINLGDTVEGEVREVAREQAKIWREAPSGSLIISGGETTVTLRNSNGKGGRNTEFLLALSIALEGSSFVGFAADTDGIDGSEDNAGAFADGQSVVRMQAQGTDAVALLERNQAFTAFETLGDLFTPGPSGTNVNDLRMIFKP